MWKNFLLLLFFFTTGFSLQAQYTETINTNRPGNSQGAFSVGTRVLQLETGINFGNETHEILKNDTDLFGVDYTLRFGYFSESLEFSILGKFLSSNDKTTVGGVTQENKFSNFKSNTFGAKYLIFDPLKSNLKDKVNVYSWKKNHNFKWKNLLPAVAVYAGLNVVPKDNPYLGVHEKNISPQLALITQHNYKSWVFVMNFIGDKLTSNEQNRLIGIFTLTHALNKNFSLFGEYQFIKNDFYSDDYARAGAAFLINSNFQLDISGLINFKDTPSKWQVATGLSYRLDMHTENEHIIRRESYKGEQNKEAEVKLIKKVEKENEK